MELFQLILLAVTTPFALIWLFLAAAKGKKYRQYTNSAFAREFQMSDLFCVGDSSYQYKKPESPGKDQGDL